MKRISNSLFEAINKVTLGQPQQLNEASEDKPVDKAHFCATHVEHPLYGEGECIAEAHADPDADGNIAWYTVQFSDGIRKVYTEAMKVKKAKMHEHAEVTDDMIDQEVADLSDDELEQSLQEANYSAKAARAGKDIGKPGKMFSKIAASAAKRYGSEERGKKVAGAVLAKLRAKSMEEGAMSDLDADRKERAYKTRQANTTMKHISNPTPGEKKAAKDIKPGIAGYRDRVAMLKSAEARGALKEDEIKMKDVEIVYVHEEIDTIQIPEVPILKDYLDAVNKLLASDEYTDEIRIAVANEAFNNEDIEIIIEAAVMTKAQKKDVKGKMDYYFGDWKPTNKPEQSKKSIGARHDIETKGGVTKATARIKDSEGMGTKQSERKAMKKYTAKYSK